ncbi:MAG: hypothetical protein V7731_01850 [Amphritea sp.]
MADLIYDKGRQAFLDGDISWRDGSIVPILIDAEDYVVDGAADQFLSDVPAAARVFVGSALTGKTSTNGIAGADPVTFPAVTGDISEAVVLVQDTGVEGTSRLIAYLDGATGLPVTPAGGDIVLQWDTGANKIFKI